MEYYKRCKNGKIIKSKDGEWCTKFSVDELIYENNFLKEKMNWENFSRKFIFFLDEQKDIHAEVKFSAQIYLTGLQFLIESSKKQLKEQHSSKNLQGETQIIEQ